MSLADELKSRTWEKQQSDKADRLAAEGFNAEQAAIQVRKRFIQGSFAGIEAFDGLPNKLKEVADSGECSYVFHYGSQERDSFDDGFEDQIRLSMPKLGPLDWQFLKAYYQHWSVDLDGRNELRDTWEVRGVAIQWGEKKIPLEQLQFDLLDVYG